MLLCIPMSFFFFFNDTATTEIYTLSLHDALPISEAGSPRHGRFAVGAACHLPRQQRTLSRYQGTRARWSASLDRKSTRLNSSHSQISYAVFCLKKKKKEHAKRYKERIIPLLSSSN